MMHYTIHRFIDLFMFDRWLCSMGYDCSPVHRKNQIVHLCSGEVVGFAYLKSTNEGEPYIDLRLFLRF